MKNKLIRLSAAFAAILFLTTASSFHSYIGFVIAFAGGSLVGTLIPLPLVK